MMKLLLLLLVAVFAVSRAEINKEELMAKVQSCIAEIQPEQEEIDLLMKHQPPVTEKGKCVRGCMFEKMGFMKNGALDIAKIIEVKSEVYSGDPDKQALSKDTILFCDKELQGNSLNSCELATAALSCYMNKAPSLYIA